MPTKLKRPCRQFGCPELTDHPTGYCDKHRLPAHQAYRQQRPDQAEQAVYNSSRWQHLRAEKRQADPFCERCARQGIVRLASLVHHKKPIRDGGDAWDWGNLESLCGSCQAQEHRGRGDRG